MDSGIWFFLIIMGACTLFFFLGLISGHDGHEDAGTYHDFGHNGGFDHGDVVGHGDDQGHDAQVKSGFSKIFSVRTMMLFGIGFGAAGAGSKVLGAGYFLTLPLAALIGVAMAYVGGLTFKLLYSQESSTDSSVSFLVGEMGRVTTPITNQGVGEIVVNNFRNEPVHLIAQSENGITIPVGTNVRVVSAGPTRAIVREVKGLQDSL
jgi:membrane protein implicated in regulation of membrane protease activity